MQLPEGWVEASCRALLDDRSIDYTGGPVRPIWEESCPPWFDRERADLWGTLAILRLRRGAVRVRGTAARSARRQHGRSAGAHRPRGWLRSRIRPQGRLAPGTGTGGILLPIPRVGARGWHAEARRGTAPPCSGSPAHRRSILPPLVVTGKACRRRFSRRRHPITELGVDPGSVLAGWGACPGSWLVRPFATRCMVRRMAAARTAWSGCGARSGFVTSFGYIRGHTAGKKENSAHQALNSRKGVPHNASNSVLTPLTTFAPRGQLRHAASNWHPAGTPWTRELTRHRLIESRPLPVFLLFAAPRACSGRGHMPRASDDSSFQDCRSPLINLIRAEQVGIDVGFGSWRTSATSREIIARKNCRRAGSADRGSQGEPDLPAEREQPELRSPTPASRMVQKVGGGIMHFKMMLFAGQNTVEFGSANYSPNAFVPVTPYSNSRVGDDLLRGRPGVSSTASRRRSTTSGPTRRTISHTPTSRRACARIRRIRSAPT